jgi:uncharacterized protein (TIGR00725 family)
MQNKKPSSDKKLVIAVIGGSQCTPEMSIKAETVGRELARRGAILVCGGLGGVMEAACRGAAIEEGTTVGILPGTDPLSANPYVQIPVATGLGEARNVAVVKSAHAVIAIDGEYGTLSEIAFALKRGIPVIGLNTWELWHEGKKIDSIIECTDAVDAVEKAVAVAQYYLR